MKSKSNRSPALRGVIGEEYEHTKRLLLGGDSKIKEELGRQASDLNGEDLLRGKDSDDLEEEQPNHRSMWMKITSSILIAVASLLTSYVVYTQTSGNIFVAGILFLSGLYLISVEIDR